CRSPTATEKNDIGQMTRRGNLLTQDFSSLQQVLLSFASRTNNQGNIMAFRRRQILQLSCAAIAAPLLSGTACAQSYPARPVRIIVPFPAGGGVDAVARLMGQRLSDRLGQPFVIENRPGASSNLATEAAVRAPTDGYSLVLVGTSGAINATLYERLNFNLIRDIEPIAGLIEFSNVMEVNPSFPAETVPEFIAYANANPGKI